MTAKSLAPFGLLVAPIVAIAIGLWAEFAELTPPVLSVVSIPAITISTISAAMLVRRVPVVPVLVVSGAFFGVLTFGLAEGSYLVLHTSRGGTLNFEGAESQEAMALALLTIHVAVGAAIGAGVGLALAVLYAGTSFVMRRATPRQAQGGDHEAVVRS